MNLKQAETIREYLSLSDSPTDSLVEATEALDEYIKSLRIKSAFECLSEYSEEEIEEACQRLKKQGRI